MSVLSTLRGVLGLVPLAVDAVRAIARAATMRRREPTTHDPRWWKRKHLWDEVAALDGGTVLCIRCKHVRTTDNAEEICAGPPPPTTRKGLS